MDEKALKKTLFASVACLLSLVSGAQVAPGVATQPLSQIAVSGGKVAFTALMTGPGPFSYQWRFNGTNLAAIIYQVAGTPSPDSGYYGDGGLATNADLSFPLGVAVDVFGDLFIADTDSQRVRMVDTNGVIITVAGNGFGGNTGDGGAATNAELNVPAGVAVDVLGNLFIADRSNHRVRKVSAGGIISTVAGNGTAGFTGDGGAATNAEMNGPSSVAVDRQGNLFISDTAGMVRKVGVGGLITTVAGTPSPGYSGDGGAATNAQLASGTPSVAVDGLGNLFIADENNQRVRKVDTNGIISTVAGNGTPGFSGDGGAATNAALHVPAAVLVDGLGNLYIADQANQRVRKVDQGGIITTIVGNGNPGSRVEPPGDGVAATNAGFYSPAGMAMDGFGNLFIADPGYSVICEVSDNGPTLVFDPVTAGNGGNYDVVIASPLGSVTSSVAALTVLLPPFPASQTHKVGESATITFSTTGPAPLNYQWLFNGSRLAGETNTTLILTNLVVAESGGYAVVVTNLNGSATSAVASLAVGFTPSILTQPTNQTAPAGSSPAFDVGPGGTGPFSYQWQLNGSNLPNNIITVAGTGPGGYSGDGGAATNAKLDQPFRVVLDHAGNLFIADSVNNSIRKVSVGGNITTVAGNGHAAYAGDDGAATNANLHYPCGVVLDAAGNLFIADTANNRIRKVDTNGIITTVAGLDSPNYRTYFGDGGAATNANLSGPYDVAVDGVGNLYIADTGNNRIRMVDTNGIISTVAGLGPGGISYFDYTGDGGPATNANLCFPVGVTLDGFHNLFIADSVNNVIRKVDTNGIITTFAGNGFQAGSGTGAYTGDGGAATNASMDTPAGVIMDEFGNLFIADQFNNCIRKVDFNGIITTVAGNGLPGYSGDDGAATNARISTPSGVALDVSGNLLVADIGNNRIRKVALADLASLTVENVSPSSAGEYQVIVTSPFGIVTSAVASLTVMLPPLIVLKNPVISGNNLLLSFNLTQGTSPSFTLLQTPNLTAAWTTNSVAVLTTNAQAGGFQFSIPMPNSVEFYRVRSP